jgi:phosphoribosylamine--glycine ligase
MASEGYPSHYEHGFEISIDPEVRDCVYVAGAKLENGKLLTSGGRVLGVTAVADTLSSAVKEAYDRVEHVKFQNAYYRHDIGARALAVKEE